MSVAKAALEHHLSEDREAADDGEEQAAGDEESPFRDALREAFDASKNGDAEAFAEAFEAAIEIKLAEK